MTMPTTLTTSEQESYDRDGIVFPIRVLSDDQAALARDQCLDLMERMGPGAKATDLTQMHAHFPWAFDLVTNPNVLDAVEGVLGPNILVWANGLFAKRPHDPSFISWHQDATYWGFESLRIATAWIALSPSTVENGCMRVVKGSQKNQIQPHKNTFAEGNLLSRGQEIQVEVQEKDATDVVLNPGEMSLHHTRIIHGSNANRSDTARIGFVVRYITPEARQHDQRPQVVLARGRNDVDHFELLERPGEKSIDEAVAAMKESARQLLESVLWDS